MDVEQKLNEMSADFSARNVEQDNLKERVAKLEELRAEDAKEIASLSSRLTKAETRISFPFLRS